ncbi:MAG TPA: sigma-70 family RNA polymerase sigma factor [Gemmatimonadota bacterium]|nr:sigma-70 family RNA polymerase sigma factor [Gemmatimonadota bacterium]
MVRAATQTSADEPALCVDDPVSQPFLDSIADPVVGLDRAWRYVYVNGAAERLKGRPATELLGRRIWDVFPEAVGTRFEEAYRKAMESGEPRDFEEFYAPIDAWYEVRAYPSAETLWIWFRDITASKLAAPRSEADRYRLLFENSPAALYRTAADGTVLDVNPALISLLGYPDGATFMRLNAADVYVDTEDRRRWRELLTRRETAVFEMRDRRYDGSVIWVRDTARSVRDEHGTVICYEGMLEDITAEKEEERSLLENEERFRLLARAADDVIWDWDLESGEVRWNRALETVFGFDPASIGPGIEQSYAWWLRHIHEDDRARVSAALHESVASGEVSWAAEYRFRRLDGTYARVYDRGFIGRGADAAPVRMIGIMVDLDRSRRPIPPDPPAHVLDRPPVPPTSDATLVTWIERGREPALGELYRRHAVTVFTVARGATSSAADAEEVVAEVFMKAWEAAGSYDPERGTVTTWLTTMARSRALERSRKARRRAHLLRAELNRRLPGEGGILPRPAIPRDPPDVAGRILVEESLADLPEAQRRVLELAYFGDLSHSEIAARLNQPLGTVKTRIRAGLSRMRRRLNGAA